MKVVPISSLEPGTEFVYRGTRGKLIRKGPGSAFVELRETHAREFTTRDGKQIYIGGNRRRVSWALAALVEVVDTTVVNGHVLIGPVAS